MTPKTITMGGKTSRPFDMRCYRAMSAKAGNRMEMFAAGIAVFLHRRVLYRLFPQNRLLV
jgi:hypothetical protein